MRSANVNQVHRTSCLGESLQTARVNYLQYCFLQRELGLDDDLVQCRRPLEARVRDDVCELCLDLRAMANEEQIEPASDLQEAVLLGIAIEPVEVALRLDGTPSIPEVGVHPVPGPVIPVPVIEPMTAQRH